jgi:hypothetical protein
MPDDRGVAYTDATQSNLWVQPFDGKPPYQLTHFTDRIIEDFAWSHDGKRLAIDDHERYRLVQGAEAMIAPTSQLGEAIISHRAAVSFAACVRHAPADTAGTRLEYSGDAG